MTEKSSIDEIRQTFDAEVETYTNLETGQAATVDSPLSMSLVAEAAAATTGQARDMVDIGCGGGNYTLKLLERLPGLNVTLVDLSRQMLDRAVPRVRPCTTGTVTAIQSDIRELDLGHERFDIILASAVLHHLRAEEEWRSVFRKFYETLKPGGSIWIFDIVESPLPEVQAIHWRRYGEYLTALKDKAFRDEMFERIIREDTPRSVSFQLDLLREVGFREIEILHKNTCYAAFGAVKR